MPTFNTDFIMYDSVYEPSTVDYGQNQIDAINSLDGNIAGLGPVTQLGLRYTTSNLGIPLNATILGFDIRIRNRINAGSGVIINRFITNTVAPDGSNSPFGSSQGIIEQQLTSTSFNNYILGYSTTSGETGIRPDSQQIVPLIDLIANDNLCLFLISVSAGLDPFQNIRFGNNSGTISLPSIGLKIYYETPEPTKVKLESSSPTIFKSLRSSETVNTTFSVGGAANRLTTANTPGTITVNNNDANVFIGGIIGVRFDQVEDLNGSTFNLSDVWDNVTNIRTRFIYSWNSSQVDNSNSFKIGWTGEANESNTFSLYNIVYNEETIFNTEDNHDVLKLYTSNINGASLANLKQAAAGDLTKLRFIFRYNDDSPDNAVILYGQGSDGGAVPAGNSLENQASLEFQITYSPPAQNYKVKLQQSGIILAIGGETEDLFFDTKTTIK